MPNYEIVINPEGGVLFMYDEANPIAAEMGEMGTAKIVRASDVRFDCKSALWRVWEILPDFTTEERGDGFSARSEAIEYEVMMLVPRLTDPGYVDKMIAAYS
jgi:hypothetical protein